MKFIRLAIPLVVVCSLVWAAGCATRGPALPMPTRVELQRFMGAWYVLGYTPILVDKNAYNAVEHYAQAPDGRILTTYQFRDGAFNGKLKTYTPTGFVSDPESNAEWRMQFVWPFKAEYVILYLSDDYQRTIIAHPNRKYAWIMQRMPEISEADYDALLGKLEREGFDRDRLHRVPHDWTHEIDRLQALDRAGSRLPLAPR